MFKTHFVIHCKGETNFMAINLRNFPHIWCIHRNASSKMHTNLSIIDNFSNRCNNIYFVGSDMFFRQSNSHTNTHAYTHSISVALPTRDCICTYVYFQQVFIAANVYACVCGKKPTCYLRSWATHWVYMLYMTYTYYYYY